MTCATETNDQVIRWLATGEVGLSSRCMALWLAFGVRARIEYPHDPDDMDRCLKLLVAAPELRDHLGRMADLGTVWAALVARWDEIEAMQMDEIGLNWVKAKSAPRTYKLMREVIDSALKRDAGRGPLNFGDRVLILLDDAAKVKP